MIDLRFVSRSVPALELGENIGKSVRVLQFRQMTNLNEIGIQEPVWGEWQDVRWEDEDLDTGQDYNVND